MKHLEPMWYEISPYVFFLIGMGAIAWAGRAGVAFGVLLSVLALLIIKMRWSYRTSVQLGRTSARRSYRRPLGTGGQRKRYRSGRAA